MNKKRKLIMSAVQFLMFIIWTILVCTVDIQAIGPDSSEVGMGTVNGYFHEIIGVNMTLYKLTDFLSIIPIALAVIFACIGFVQMIKFRSLLKVDFGLLCLGAFYIVVMLAFIVFEAFPVNYRPVLIDGSLEASYPSSTTLMVTAIMLTAITILKRRIKSDKLFSIIRIAFIIFTVLMVVGRILSGVHWVSDIIAGILLSLSFVTMYNAVTE